MDDTTPGTGGQHELTIVNRESLKLTGVLHVDSFDDQEIVVDTEQGLLTMRGEDLHIKHLNLDAGELRVEGVVAAVSYSAGARAKGGRGKARSIWERLLR